MTQSVLVQPCRYVRPALASAVTGLTEKAIERKIETGVWVEGIHFKVGQDGLRYIDLLGYEKWVEQAPALRPGKRASG